MKTPAFTLRILLCVTTLLICFASIAGQTDVKLEQAVAELRNISMDNLSDDQKTAKAQSIDESWKYLISVGPKAVMRLKEEIKKVDADNKKDDFFKLNATVVIWEISKTNEADYIADVWNTTPIFSQYTYVFLTAFQAAQTQDPKVLPMLKAVLNDSKGSIFVGSHSMNVAWPLSHEFVWGAYGSKGIPVLFEVLESSNDTTELRSAMHRLTQAQFLPSLARIRQLAADKRSDVRRTAVMSLGRFGHPADYEFLVNGLKSTDPDDIFAFAFALYEFDDERAVPHLLPHLKSTADNVRLEVSLALLHLLTPETLAAVEKETANITNTELRKFIERSLTLRKDKLPADYSIKSRAEQTLILAKIREDRLFDSPSDKKATNQQLLAAAAEWKSKGRIYKSSFEWLRTKQMIDAGTPKDIDTLLDVKAIFYKRLSDECLYETGDIDKAIKYIGRSRYRAGVGIANSSQRK